MMYYFNVFQNTVIAQNRLRLRQKHSETLFLQNYIIKQNNTRLYNIIVLKNYIFDLILHLSKLQKLQLIQKKT